MINLQDRMNKLQVHEAEAHKEKIAAERKIQECSATWYQIYKEYLSCREKLNALNK